MTNERKTQRPFLKSRPCLRMRRVRTKKIIVPVIVGIILEGHICESNPSYRCPIPRMNRYETVVPNTIDMRSR